VSIRASVEMLYRVRAAGVHSDERIHAKRGDYVMDGEIVRTTDSWQYGDTRRLVQSVPWAREFRTTRQGLVRAAAAGGERARRAFALLYKDYWYPLLSYIAKRRGWEQAAELTQAFFASRLLNSEAFRTAKATRLRIWLRGEAKRFLARDARFAHQQCRNVDMTVPFDSADDAGPAGTTASRQLNPEQRYWRSRAIGMLEETLGQLRSEYCRHALAAGVADPEVRFDTVKRFLPQGEAEANDITEAARALGTSVEGVRQLVCQLRKRFGTLLNERLSRGPDPDAARDPDPDVSMVKRLLYQALELPPEAIPDRVSGVSGGTL
jgi:hypothetical protein